MMPVIQTTMFDAPENVSPFSNYSGPITLQLNDVGEGVTTQYYW
jgi:hypothetical protein